jgi:putative FmdB family regulatory protein
MPIYEYLCLECGRVCDHLVLNRETFEPYCKHCGSRNMKKLISRVRVRLSMDTRLERMADPALLGAVDENDPRSMMKLMERMGAEFGDELGDDFDELMESAREEMEEELCKEDSGATGDAGVGLESTSSGTGESTEGEIA